MAARLPDDEADRLASLYEHRILDTPPEEHFDDLARLAAHVCGVPIAAVSLIDSRRQWFKAVTGIATTEASRDDAFCAHTILHPELTVVSDTQADPRFADNPLVTGDPHIRFYAGAPLFSEDAYALGALCVIDRVARTLTPAQETALALLARQASVLLRASRRLAQWERFFTLSLDILCIAGNDGYFKRVNSMFRQTLGYTEADLLATPILEFVHPDDRAATLASREAISRGALTPDFENRYRCWDGSYRWLRWNTVSDAETGRKYAAAHDITERKRAEAQVRDHAILLESQKRELERANAELAALATTDGLTGLRNHRAFQERLGEEVGRAARYGVSLSLIMLDVDRFKQYNDTYGHPAGDAVLKTVAEFLRESTREADLVSRYGGEEFALILPETDLAGAAAFAERLRAALEAHRWPVRPVTASFGVAALWAGEESGSGLITRADDAMYCSKAAGRNRVACAAALPLLMTS